MTRPAISNSACHDGRAESRVYRVAWCDRQKAFIAVTDDGKLLAHSSVRSEVAEIALREATLASAQGVRVAVQLECRAQS